MRAGVSLSLSLSRVVSDSVGPHITTKCRRHVKNSASDAAAAAAAADRVSRKKGALHT